METEILSSQVPAWMMAIVFVLHVLWSSFIADKKALAQQRERLDDMSKTMSTKDDLNVAKAELKNDLSSAKTELKNEITNLVTRMDKLIETSKAK